MSQGWATILPIAFFGGIAAGLMALVLLMRKLQPLPTLPSANCTQCGYDLSRTDPKRSCPECGVTRARMLWIEKNRFFKPRILPVTAAATVMVVAVLVGLLILFLVLKPADLGTMAFATPFLFLGLFPPVAVVFFAARRLMWADATLIAVLGSLPVLVAYLLVLLSVFHWTRPDAQAGLVVFSGPIISGGVGGWGVLLAAFLIITERQSRPRQS